MTDELSVWVVKITSKIGISWTHSQTFCFWPNLNSLNSVHIYKIDNFESQNSLKLCFTSIWGLRLNIVDWIFPGIKLSWHSYSMWDKLGWLNWFWHFLCEGLSSRNPKGLYYSYAWSCSLCEGRTSFSTGVIFGKLCRFLLMFSTGFTPLSVLFLFPLLITFFVFVYRFYSISSNTDEVLSINSSANISVFGDFNIHHKDWLTPDCDSESSALFDFFLSAGTSTCSTMAFPPLGNSDLIILLSEFPLNFL